jgi:predicted ATP-grasp superfamily ATP-dependent carboligase
LLGVTRQLVGQGWLGARPFQYCGSIGPLPLDPATLAQWEKIGTVLADEAELTGVFGVDAIVDHEGRVWVVEVNPRYSASVEVLERSGRFSAVGQLLAADDQPGVDVAAGSGNRGHEAVCWGKAIVMAARDILISDPLCDYIDRANRWAGIPIYVDLPWPGQVVRVGSPILTLLACGHGEREVAAKLRRRAEWLWSYLR